MCGIAGIHAYHYASSPADRDELARMRDHMRRRGPDAEGTWISADGRAALAHRRLAIIDLDARANQPMASDDGKVVISYNGEIYNHAALRVELEARGCRFRTHSDTEVLLHLYRERGDRMFAALRGMYAFALWDADRHAMLLARDAFGIKPLYYADDGWTCRFASQVKALVAGGKISSQREPAGLVGFYLLGSVPEPYTLYQEIRAVPAGCHVWVDSTGARAPVQHFSIAKAWSDAIAASPRSRGEAGAQGAPGEGPIRDALLDSVRHHLVADVPVGAFLSGGIDSGALVGLMRDAGQQRIHTVTVAFDEFSGKADDESPLAALTARTYGTEHRVRRVTLGEFVEDLPRVLAAMDQPSIDGINTWFVAKAAAEQGLKVALSGLGADELFGGYPSFRDVPRWTRRLWLASRVPGAGALFERLAAALPSGTNPKVRGMLRYGGTTQGAWFLKRAVFMPADLPQLLDAGTVREGLRRLDLEGYLRGFLEPDPGSDFARVSTLESSLYMRNQLLRDADWASMAHSLEVRVPYVDTVLLKAAAQAGPADKRAIAASPRTALPGAVVNRPKTGFTTPVPKWLEQQPELRAWRGIAQLRKPACPWARRWSHEIGARFAGLAA